MRAQPTNWPGAKPMARVLTALLFVAAGVMHFIKPAFYVRIIPPALPWPLALVYISGVWEILGGIGLLVPPARSWAGNGLILLLIAVFPANIYMLIENFHEHDFSLSTFLLALRLPLQFVFIAVVKYVARPYAH